MIHSVPLFPPIPEDGYGYPSTGESFGQTAICITFKYDQFTEIGMKSFSQRKPLSHHASLIAFLEVSPQKFLVLDWFLSHWETKWGLERAFLVSVMFIQ